jgi:hypothetical protein
MNCAMPLCKGRELRNSRRIASGAINGWFNAALRRPQTDEHAQMIVFLSLLPAFLGLASAQDWFPAVRMSFVQDEMVLRVPTRPPSGDPSQWDERKGPKCIRADEVRGAVLSSPEQVDFVLDDGKRMRAGLEKNCPALDFYEGFYLSSRDKKICVRRDVVRSRMGGSCTIEKFRKLVPAKHRVP